MAGGALDRIHLFEEAEFIARLPSIPLLLRVFRVLRVLRGKS